MGLAIVTAIGSSLAFADDLPGFNARCGELDCRLERTEATWQVTSVDDLRFLELAYESGGCRVGHGLAKVIETRSRIRIAVDQSEIVAVDTPDGKPVCTDEVVYRKFWLRLNKPVGGRRIIGGPRILGRSQGLRRTTTRHGRVIPLVPGLVDLAKLDAGRVLKSQGFQVRWIGKPSGPVAFQTPGEGKGAARNTVRVTVGRGLFATRPLKACFEGAGFRTVVKRPTPDNVDAPDLALRLYRPTLSAFVALYADPARAKEQLRSIRRRTRQFRGTVDRRRGAIIVWVTVPQSGLATQVRRCATGKLGLPIAKAPRSTRDSAPRPTEVRD